MKTMRKFLLSLALLCCAFPARAQWVSQTLHLKTGWTAIYLNIDLSYTTIDQLVGDDPNNPVLEIQRWAPAGDIQFADSPLNPLDGGNQWTSWVRATPNSQLQRLVGNSAYLVRIGVATFDWTVKGQPVPPRNDWTSTGLNFLGFSTVPLNPPTFEAFVSQSPTLQQDAQIFYYPGGALGAGNPAPLTAYRTSAVNRGQAYWARASTFNRYFGPFELDLKNSSGIDFGSNRSSFSFRIRNATANPLTVTLNLVLSETPPSGQPAISAVPPLLIRGEYDVANLVFGYSGLPVNTPKTWILPARGTPGSEIEVVVGLNRSAISVAPGTFFAGVLRFTDSLHQSQVDVPVSAVAASSAGLWVGRALVTQVGQYLKTYHRDLHNNPVAGPDGNYVVAAVNTEIRPVMRPFPLRLIVHNPEQGGTAALLQHVFVGVNTDGLPLVATQERSLDPKLLPQARRVSAAHLPWSTANQGWRFDGRLGAAGSQLQVTVPLDYADQSSNPFLHTFHPDHDNLDVSFKNLLDQGAESYTVARTITLKPKAPANDFAQLIASGSSIGGDYLETIQIKGLKRGVGTQDTRTFEARGVFSLNRISDAPTLTTPP
jgi:hypothetical protein